jgi:phosphate ABC transporter phosphate-binding protein
MNRTHARSAAASWMVILVVFAISMVLFAFSAIPAPRAQGATYVPISGAGSTWSSNAIEQWAANVKQFGMTVNFQSSGSSDGRKQFANDTVDFGISEIPYGLLDQGRRDDAPSRKFAYMPVVAGGTAFMYNLKIGNKQVSNLRLSGETITKIFTGVIKLWSDPAIKKDNPGLTLPARKVIPVVRSDGSGTTAQFSLWMSKKYPALWNAYCVKAGRTSPCGLTSNYPVVPGSGFTAQQGSLGVSGYVSQKSSEGAITYVEYSYPLNVNFPVVKMLNSSGYYVLPTAPNVAVGLLKATINKDLTQNLDGVYANADRRAYPLSSYSYMIVPTGTTNSFSTAKGTTLRAFNKFFLCEGQQQAADLGYSPLPINLVKAGLEQVKKIPGDGAADVDIRKCNNPTFSPDGTNVLAKTAPFPAACDKQGATQCGGSTAGRNPTSGAPAGGNAGSGGGAGAGGTDGSTANGGSSAANPDGTTSAGQASAGAVDPETGEVLNASGDVVSASGEGASAVPVALAANYAAGNRTALMLLAGVLLIAVTVGPPVVSRTFAERRQR